MQQTFAEQRQQQDIRRLLLATAFLIFGGVVVAVSFAARENSSSEERPRTQTLQFFCPGDEGTSVCYSDDEVLASSCLDVQCCEVATATKSSSLLRQNLVSCESSPSLSLASCIEADVPPPTNPSCPSLPFYALPKTDVPPGDTLTVGAVGDILLESTMQRQAARHSSYAEAWQAVTPLLQRSDIAFANHEGTASFVESIPDNPDDMVNFTLTDVDRGPQPLRYADNKDDSQVFYSGGPYLQFNYHPMLAADLASSGIDVVSTANNHCLDRGLLGINSTLDALDDAGVAYTGTRRSTDESWHVHIDRKGWRIAWVACTDGTNFQRNRRDRAADLVLNCFSERFVDLVLTLAADPTTHAVVAVVHWGSSPPKDAEGDAAREMGYGQTGFGTRGIVYQRQPDCAMRHWARRIAEAGAAVVLGMHPHVLHGFERYVTSYGRETLIVHSLGNFASHGGYLATKPPPAFLGRGYDSQVGFLLRRTSVLLEFGLQWNASRNWAQVACLSYVPLYRRLSDIGFVEPAMTAENKTTYEIHVLTAPASEKPVENSFVGERFGPLKEYANGGGVYNGQSWEAALDIETNEYAPSCYPLSDAPVSAVDAGIYSGVLHQNDNGRTVSVATGYCLRCEPVDNEGPEDGCRWCEYKRARYCKGPSSSKIRLGQALPFDECLSLVAQHANCSQYAYAGGGLGRCTCMRKGETCNLAKSKQSQVVYRRECGSVPQGV